MVYDLFPQGLKATHAALLKQRGGRPIEIKAHATNWDVNSPYRNDSRFLDTNWCGDGPRSCAGEKAPAMFLPGVELYSYLFKSGKEWGLSHVSSASLALLSAGVGSPDNPNALYFFLIPMNLF